MRIDIITLVPEFFDGLRDHSIVGRAIKNGKLELVVHNLRDWAKDSYGSVDARPYGGGPGMVLRVDVVAPAIAAVREIQSSDHSRKQGSELSKTKVILTTPQGEVYKQSTAQELSTQDLIIVCGHYEGWDERIREYVDCEISIGDYVLTGGELPAMIITDSVVRLLPGVLGDDSSSHDESHSASSGQAHLEYPQYTRPSAYEDKVVPEILLGGNHKEIDKWRRGMAEEKTKKLRPDLVRE